LSPFATSIFIEVESGRTAAGTGHLSVVIGFLEAVRAFQTCPEH
jgi:hypothetical protein